MSVSSVSELQMWTWESSWAVSIASIAFTASESAPRVDQVLDQVVDPRCEVRANAQLQGMAPGRAARLSEKKCPSPGSAASARRARKFSRLGLSKLQ